jgi:putative acetyltransferase
VIPTGVRIRPQQPGERERDAVREVVEAAFADVTVADLVDALQADEAGRLGASLVAVDEADRVVGHVQLSRSWLDAPSRLVEVLVLSPLAVAPGRQGEGIGGALVRAAIEAADDLAAPLLFLEGSPRYYPRFGFVPGGPLGFLRPSVRIPEAAFQVIKLPTWEPWMTGQLVYSEVFWRHDAVGLRE